MKLGYSDIKAIAEFNAIVKAYEKMKRIENNAARRIDVLVYSVTVNSATRN